MGFMMYDGVNEFEFDDRVLAHLKFAIGIKLRRQESFFLNWTNEPDQGSGRVSIWISPTIPVMFRFSGSRPPMLNQQWVQLLVDLASTPRGMTVVREDQVEGLLEQGRTVGFGQAFAQQASPPEPGTQGAR